LTWSDPPRVSVVMPAYNAEDYVSLAIDSVLGQSFADFELIVVDDGSTDSTPAIVKGFDDARVRYGQTSGRAGAGGARNAGLGLARGKYVAFLDADDLAYPKRLATQFAYMEAQPETALLGAGYDVIDAAGRVLATVTNPSGTASVRLKMLFDNVIATSLAFARRDVLLDVGLFDGSLAAGAEDHDMWSRVASRFPIARLPDVLGAYRDHGAGTYRAGSAGADAMRARVVGRVIESCLGVEVSLGTAMLLGSASSSSDYTLEDSITALALLEVLPLSPLWLWADSAAEQRAMTRVLLDKLVAVVCREPRLHRDALRAAARALRDGRPRRVWDRATLRSLIRLALAPGGRSRCGTLLTACRRADSGVAGTRGES
jgi:Glycosyl transferase family 2